MTDTPLRDSRKAGGLPGRRSPRPPESKRNGPSGGELGPSGLRDVPDGGNRHGSDVGSRSAVAIKLSVTVACFEITNGLFGQYQTARPRGLRCSKWSSAALVPVKATPKLAKTKF
jgi:hypothetical protein